MAKFDKKEILSECEAVRDDNQELNWVSFGYEGCNIVKIGSGEDYEEMFEVMRNNDDRVFTYVRIFTGDELSKRSKFAFVTYYGSSIGAIAKARCSTDKPALKDACPGIAAELLFENQIPTLDEITKKVRKAGGANYDAQA